MLLPLILIVCIITIAFLYDVMITCDVIVVYVTYLALFKVSFKGQIRQAESSNPNHA